MEILYQLVSSQFLRTDLDNGCWLLRYYWMSTCSHQILYLEMLASSFFLLKIWARTLSLFDSLFLKFCFHFLTLLIVVLFFINFDLSGIPGKLFYSLCFHVSDSGLEAWRFSSWAYQQSVFYYKYFGQILLFNFMVRALWTYIYFISGSEQNRRISFLSFHPFFFKMTIVTPFCNGSEIFKLNC